MLSKFIEIGDLLVFPIMLISALFIANIYGKENIRKKKEKLDNLKVDSNIKKVIGSRDTATSTIPPIPPEIKAENNKILLIGIILGILIIIIGIMLIKTENNIWEHFFT